MSTSLTHSQSLRFLLLYDSSSDEVLNRQRIQSQSGSVCPFTGKPHYTAGSEGKKKTLSARDVQDNDLVWVHDYPLLLALLLLLFRRYLNDKAKGNEIDWERISPPKPEQVVDYPVRTRPPNTSTNAFSH
jgi:UDP-N-acetylglucosamine pyrophosphorylase